MSVLIDLDGYHREVEAFASLAGDFVDKASSLQLTEVAKNLRTGIDQGRAEWSWTTRSNIVFRASNSYDAPGKEFPNTRFELGFTCSFLRPAKTRRSCTVWKLDTAATHVSIVCEESDGRLYFHFDYKNANQWGPQVHFQVSEQVGNLPIPRLVTTAFLPTDCADLILSELHHEEWRKLQFARGSQANVSVLRDAQEHRTMSYLRDIAALWNDDRAYTRFTMLQDYTSRLKALPDQRGRAAKAGW